MGFLLTLLGLPVLGPAQLVRWLGSTISEQALAEYLDEGKVRGELLELQQRYDTGDIGDEEYDRLEKALLERIDQIREFKAAGNSAG
ncbi:MAG: gas vesicle protein GvpG [Chloroflexi bacterium]|nr:gas vesicle protein GvpG [Chloroflexota bacterium]